MLLCYAAFLVYATLWPFDFQFARELAISRKISWIPFFDPMDGPNRKDALMNILVFLPFGILSFLANSASGKLRRPVLVSTLLGGALSLSVELAQIGLPTRHPATADLLMNITGALLGALLARTLQGKVHDESDVFRLWIRRNPIPLASIVYALALLASSMRTFDPILKWRALEIRAGAFIGSSLLPDHLDCDNAAWMVLSFGFLSFLVAEGFARSSMIRRRRAGYVVAFIVCSLFVLFLEATQVLFRSRHPLLSHAILGFLGVGYGIVWQAIAGRYRDAGSKDESPFRIWIPLFFTHYPALVFLAFLSPIPHSIHNFQFDPRGFIPFYFCLHDISLSSFYAATKTMALYIPMGFVWCRATDEMSCKSCWIPILFSIGLQAMIEIGKGYFGYRFPDPSNMVLAALGGYGGVKTASILRSI